MGRDNTDPVLPPRVKAAFDFLYHTWRITEQTDSAIPTRPLTALERSVETAALRAVQQYLLGEMDFADEPADAPEKHNGEDGSTQEPVPSTS
jgi:hypothetical protein